MKFLSRLLTKVKEKSVTFLSSSSLGFNTGSEDILDSHNLRTFKDSLYLFIGVSMIRDTVSSIPLELYQIKNKDGDVEELNDDPLLDLFSTPNKVQTQKEFWKLSISYYLLAGEVFWYLEREGQDTSTIPTAMACLRPDHVEILLSQDKKTIVGYEFYQIDGSTIKLRPEDVLHIRNVDPTNPLRGVGVVRPASQRIITEREASKYQADTFRTHGRPDIAVFTDTDINSESAKLYREKWREVYGKDTGSQAGFFGKDVKSVQLLTGISPKEMDFMGTQEFLRDDILAALHIPKAMVTSDDVNLANSKTARINYIKEACLPVYDAFIDVVNNRFIYGLKQSQDKFFTYESPVNEDRELLLKEAVELKKAGIVTINESRNLLNYPEIDGGDVRESSSSNFGSLQLSVRRAKLKAYAKQIIKKRKVLVRKFEAIEAITELFEAENKSVKRERNPVFNTKETKAAYARAYINNIDKKAEVFKDNIDAYNDGLLKRIIKQMEDFGINPDNIFNASSEIVEAKKVFVPLMKKMYSKAGQDTLDLVANGFTEKASEHFYTIDEVLQELELRAEFFIISMLDTDFKQMQTIIALGLQEGQGVAVIGRSLRKYFTDMSVARARTIARTETGRLISQATNEAYRQSEVVTGKEWLTARDDKVRDRAGTVDDHVINEFVVVATDGIFPNGERFPGEKTINCRCALAPAV